MEAASKIIFDFDEGLDIKAAALQRYVLTLEANSVKFSALGAGDLNFYTPANGIIDSGASATFATSRENTSSASVHKSQLRTANGQMCYTSHLWKNALPICKKALRLPNLVASTFGEDLISVAQQTMKGNKVLFTNKSGLLLGPSENLDEGTIIGVKGNDNLYMRT